MVTGRYLIKRNIIVIMLNIVKATITFMLKLNANPQIECQEHNKT